MQNLAKLVLSLIQRSLNAENAKWNCAKLKTLHFRINLLKISYNKKEAKYKFESDKFFDMWQY